MRSFKPNSQTGRYFHSNLRKVSVVDMSVSMWGNCVILYPGQTSQMTLCVPDTDCAIQLFYFKKRDFTSLGVRILTQKGKCI